MREDVFRNSSCIAACVSYAGLGSLVVGYKVLIALWLQKPFYNFGRNYGSNEVASLYLISGMINAIINYTVLGKINSMMPIRFSFVVWLLGCAFTIGIIPTLWYIKNDNNFFVALLIANSIVLICFTGCYIPNQVFQQNSVPRRSTAFVFAVSHFLCNLVEGLVVGLFASAYDWFTEQYTVNPKANLPFLHFPFFLLSISVLLNYIPVHFMRDNIDKIIKWVLSWNWTLDPDKVSVIHDIYPAIS